MRSPEIIKARVWLVTHTDGIIYNLYFTKESAIREKVDILKQSHGQEGKIRVVRGFVSYRKPKPERGGK